MTRWLFVLFLIVPLLDLFVLVTLGGRLGFWPTVALVTATALLGAWLAKREGLAALRRVQARLASGALPGPELVDGLIILLSGALLLTPGFLTDAVGLLGLIPPARALVRRQAEAALQRSLRSGRVRFFGGAASPFGGAGMGHGPPNAAPHEGVYGRPAPTSARGDAGGIEDAVDVTFEDVAPRRAPGRP